jgi:Putative peptidoglycan binding domain/D-alanyl-D-alanine carboxypeptidase
VPISQNSWPASADRAAIGVKTFAVPGRPDVLLPVRADIAPLLLEMARWWNEWETLLVPGCWGYAYRSIRGQTTGLSNHASGTAIDLNAPRHPLGSVGTLGVHKDAVIAKARSLGLRSGADYAGRKDEMHVEVAVGHAEAMAIVARLQTPPAPTNPGARPTVRRGSTGPAVALAQRWFGLTADGVFGPITEAKVRWYQRMKGLTPDGIIGPHTWAAMGL